MLLLPSKFSVSYNECHFWFMMNSSTDQRGLKSISGCQVTMKTTRHRVATVHELGEPLWLQKPGRYTSVDRSSGGSRASRIASTVSRLSCATRCPQLSVRAWGGGLDLGFWTARLLWRCGSPNKHATVISHSSASGAHSPRVARISL